MAVETTLAAVGLVVAFKGAVDGYLLFDNLFTKDNGIRDLALQYHIERVKLTNWGDRYRVNSDQEDCLLNAENKATQEAMAAIFGRIQTLHAQADRVLEYYDMSDFVDSSTTGGQHDVTTKVKQYLKLGSAKVTAVSQIQSSKKQRSRIKWTIKDKDKFSTIVSKLRGYNEDLRSLLSSPSQETFERTLPGYVLAGLASRKDLLDALSMRGGSNDMIREAAQLSVMQSTADQNHGPSMLDFEAFTATTVLPGSQNEGSTLRTVGVYHNTTRVWVEWHIIEDNGSTTMERKIRERIRTLSAMLSYSDQAFRRSQCIGYLEDDNDARRVGLAYRSPEKYGRAQPTTLLEIIDNYKSIGEPPLGDKFQLAKTLALALAQLHASNWLHKAFRSDNILFFAGLTPNITDPYLAGFQHSRETTMESIEYRPSGRNAVDYYYHPNVANGFSKKFDVYSLGVVLLEIAFWRPLRSKFPKKHNITTEDIHKLLIQSAQSGLDRVMGKIYADVVTTCLTCGLPESSDAEFACAMHTDIIRQLEQCNA